MYIYVQIVLSVESFYFFLNCNVEVSLRKTRWKSLTWSHNTEWMNSYGIIQDSWWYAHTSYMRSTCWYILFFFLLKLKAISSLANLVARRMPLGMNINTAFYFFASRFFFFFNWIRKKKKNSLIVGELLLQCVQNFSCEPLSVSFHLPTYQDNSLSWIFLLHYFMASKNFDK